MKRRILTITFLLLTFFNCSAFENLKFSISPALGFLSGETGEYIFASSDDYYVSFLEWNMESLYSVGIDLSARYKKLYLDGSFDYFIPTYCGYMYDSDYNDSFMYNLCTLKNKNLFSIIGEVGLGYDFNLSKEITIGPYAQFDYTYNYFSTDKGSGYFGAAWATGKTDDVPWNDPSARYAASVSGINLRIENISIFAGLNASLENEKWFIKLSSLIAPFYTATTLDYHRDENNNGKDEDYNLLSIQNGYFTRFKERLLIGYNFSDNLALSLEIKALISSLIKGPMATDMYKDSFGIMNEDWTVTSQKAGSKVNYFQTNFGIILKF